MVRNSQSILMKIENLTRIRNNNWVFRYKIDNP